MARLPVLRGNGFGSSDHRRAASSALTRCCIVVSASALVLFLTEEPVEKRLGQPLPEDDLCPIVSRVESNDVVRVRLRRMSRRSMCRDIQPLGPSSLSVNRTQPRLSCCRSLRCFVERTTGPRTDRLRQRGPEPPPRLGASPRGGDPTGARGSYIRVHRRSYALPVRDLLPVPGNVFGGQTRWW